MVKKMIILITLSLLALQCFAIASIELNISENTKEQIPVEYIYGNTSTIIKSISGTFPSEILEKKIHLGTTLTIDGLKNKSLPNKPSLPIQNIEISISGNYDVTGISLENQAIMEGKTKGNLTSNQKRVTWNKKLVDKNKQAEPKDSYLPGNWATFTAGYDGENTKVYIHIYPVQWNPVTRKFFYLESYAINIHGMPVTLSNNNLSRDLEPTPAEHIMIVPEEWTSVADSIATFHNTLGIYSSIVTLEDICLNYEAVTDPTAPGYATDQNFNIPNYEYVKAKQIIAYLRDNDAHPNLENITLVGSGHIIPPSYYFFFELYPEYPLPEYHQWLPSDHYYSSPDFDYVDNFGSSRITVSTVEELSSYYHKMQNWVDAWNSSWTNNASVAGGCAFDTHLFCGELMSNQVISDDLFSSYDIEKYYSTLGNFTPTAMSNHLQNDDFMWHFHVSHGSGDAIYFDDYFELNGEQIVDYPQKNELPIFLSVACIDGAYDSELYQEDWTGISFAESLLRSSGGAIAYIGGSRSNGGMSEFNVDDGNIVYTGINDTYALLYYYIESYRELQDPTFGDLFKSAKDKYLLEQDITESTYNIQAYFRFIAHADAGLTLPIAPRFIEQPNIPMVNLENAEGSNEHAQYGTAVNQNGPLYTIVDHNENRTVNSYVLHLHPEYGYSYLCSFNNILQDFEFSDNFYIPLYNRDYLILNRIEDINSKESIHYSEVSVEFTSIEENLLNPNLEMSVYPNPFNPSTNISFTIKNSQKVKIEVFNIKGQKVKSVLSEQLPAGNHTVVWDGKDENNNSVASSVYFVKIKTKNRTMNQKVVLLK